MIKRVVAALILSAGALVVLVWYWGHQPLSPQSQKLYERAVAASADVRNANIRGDFVSQVCKTEMLKNSPDCDKQTKMFQREVPKVAAVCGKHAILLSNNFLRLLTLSSQETLIEDTVICEEWARELRWKLFGKA